MTLTKANIVNLLRAQLGLPKKDCLKIVNAYFEEISKSLEKGEEIKIPNLGNFVVKHKKEDLEEIQKQASHIKFPTEMLFLLKHQKNLESLCKIGTRLSLLT